MKRCALVAIATIVTAQAGFAQIGGNPGPTPQAFGAGPFGHAMNRGKVIAGSPYTADVNNSVLQKLADGNTISRSTVGHVARDSQGRTYLQEDISGGPWAQKGPTTLTFLSDPVAGYTYVLDATKKVAMRRVFKTPDAYVQWSGKDFGSRGPHHDSDNLVESELTPQQINGVTANGKSVVRTIPAGTIGNAQPIVVKSEVWTSPDLQIVVLSKRDDPRMGLVTYSLSNIQRAEPNASLFQVPSDYTIEDAPAFGDRRGHQP